MTQYDLDADRFGDDGDEPAALPTCNRCGEGRTWHHTGLRWALLDDAGRLHNCSVGASADEFDDLTSGDSNG
jgi:hypothetical protein